jgi:hypothetical protein
VAQSPNQTLTVIESTPIGQNPSKITSNINTLASTITEFLLIGITTNHPITSTNANQLLNDISMIKLLRVLFFPAVITMAISFLLIFGSW